MSPERIGDMDNKSRLGLVRDASGDIHVLVFQYHEGRLLSMAEVEFCTIPRGGGRSPNTFEALLKLMEAIDKDNKLGKTPSQIYNPPFDSDPE